ncbi:uncharacterized protein LOC131687320 [Topomyia yanbarensis]|uniref:uncharacterized protein LOC131687320 n=1 Tax=Topomyia yanbarensis TaxID=2498891 RepID=UPI00273B301B|nr:uncharacterized protein LOC131687320 [Topomyia yanbarensis]
MPKKSTKNTVDEESDVVESSCQECDASDNQEMVQCDYCQKWSHFTCAAVTEAVENIDWCCKRCTKMMLEQIKASGKKEYSTPEKPKSTTPSRRSNLTKIKMELQRLEEEERIRQEEEQAAAAARVKRREFLEKKSKLLSDLAKSEASGSEVASQAGVPGNEVEQWLDSIPMGRSPEKPTAPPLEDEPIHSRCSANCFTETGILTSGQVAARQAVSKELPVFNGSPEEWPMFYATFISTTEMCGYSSAENMVRLQRCLRGRALESVRCRLLHPENVNGVIDTLKMLFGRPEIIVQSLIGKVQALPTPRADKLNTLVDFGIAVSNLTATLEACQLNEYLCNISLLQELVEKLPPMVKLNWATHRRCIKNVNLSEFSSWLYTLVEAACSVTSPFTGAISDTPYNRKTRKNDGFVNAHSESADPRSGCDEETLTTWRACSACNGRCTSTDRCPRFTSMDVESRWVVVRERGLCRRCLRKHTGLCRSRKECGVNGCGYKHHSMLHNDTREINQTTTNRALAGEDSGDNTGPVEPCNTHRGITDSVLFRIVPVVLHGPRMTIQTYALFDDGSSLTLIDEEIAETLQLPGEPYPLWLKWTGDTCRHEASSRRVSVEISGTGPAAKRYYLENVHTVEELNLPRQTVNIKSLAENISIYEEFQLILSRTPVLAY